MCVLILSTAPVTNISYFKKNPAKWDQKNATQAFIKYNRLFLLDFD